MERTAGFQDQRLCVVPRPLILEALTRPATRRIVVTDAGYFPRAASHVRRREHGTDETIVIVCVAGSGWVETPGARVRVTPATAVVLPGGIPHAYGSRDDDPWTIWWCHVRGSDVPDLVAAIGVDRGNTMTLRAVDRLAAMFDEIVSALEHDQSAGRLLVTAGMAWRMFTQLAADGLLRDEGEPLARAMRYLEERVDGTIRVPALAALVGVSPSRLTTLFRESTGGGVLAYHLAVKMARARHLLDTSSASVAAIGREVGMADQFYFSRRFRHTHGVSPREYRALRKG